MQRAATALLRGLGDPKAAHAAGLYGFRLLNEGDDPSKIMYSFTLFERGEHSNLLRVQTDNFDQPFDLNEGARLDLGSTAKLRTLVTYLELVAELHQRWSALPAEQLAALKISRRDPLAPLGARLSGAGRRQEPGGDARRGDGAHATRPAPAKASSPAAACTTSRTSSPRTTTAR